VVRQMLQHLGAFTINADTLGHQAMMPGAPAYRAVIETFGTFIVADDGRINRQVLGDMVFSNPDALRMLEGIVHPVVRQAIDILVKRAKQRVVVIEAIKLLESDWVDDCDVIWVVDAPVSVQLQRLVERRQLSEAAAMKRIKAQHPQSEKLARADVIIHNDGDIERTWQQVKTHWRDLRHRLEKGQPSASTPGQAMRSGDTQVVTVAGTAATPGAGISPPEIVVRRGMPNSARRIADFINAATGQALTREDILLNFGQKSYLMAEVRGEPIALIGWNIENLITSVDEFYIMANAPAEYAIGHLMEAIEVIAGELNSEVGFVFLEQQSPAPILAAFEACGYAPTTILEIRVPAWREAVEFMLRGQASQLLWKRLREERILRPI
jgi:dephospho-CoA kinase